MARPPRIWISNETPAAAEIVRIRAQIAHPMETGFRSQPDGTPIPRDTVDSFRAWLGDTLLMEWLPETAIATNPYIEFTFAARSSGTLRMVWTDSRGDFAEAEREIAVQA